ncbi:ribosomal protein S4 [Acrasis kona]|uniref:Ribosomal protein S4 n=1 Tax=Acrasis kona TaxID=1008807 RepID=A0AAW2ZHZ4_9EUKA
MGIPDQISDFTGRLKSDKGLIVRVLLGLLFVIALTIMGFALFIRTAVYNNHPTKHAIEYIGFNDKNFEEIFPRISVCPGYHNDSTTGHFTMGVIDKVECTFIQLIPESPDHVEPVRTPVQSTGPVEHTIDYRKYTNCFDINMERTNSPKVGWQNPASQISCRINANSWVHVHVYNFNRDKPSHLLSHWNTLKNGEATKVSLKYEEVANTKGETWGWYAIDKEDEELRFGSRGQAPDHLYVSFGFDRIWKSRYQVFHTAHQFGDITFGQIGGICFLFYMLWKLIAWFTTLFGGDRAGYENA